MEENTNGTIEQMELLLRGICFAIKKKGREILQDFNITPPQFDALQFLIYEGEMTVSELSCKLYLAPSTITDLVDRMEKNNLVKRVRDEKDRRTVKLTVLENGLKLLEEVIARRCSYLEKLTEKMDEEEKRSFTGYLELMSNTNQEN